MSEAPQLSALDVHYEDSQSLREQLAAALAASDLEAVQRLLEPQLHELAGKDWRLVVADDKRIRCDYEQKELHLGADAFSDLEIETQAALLEIVFLHELGHSLYTQARVESAQLRAFALAGHQKSPEVLAADFAWLDNVFADARLRGSWKREAPQLAVDEADDERFAVEFAARSAYRQLGLAAPADLSEPEAFAALPAREQLGLLLMARLNDSPWLAAWSGSAAAPALACFAELEPLLGQVREGQGAERLELLPDCYRILCEHDLVADSQALYRALDDQDYWQQRFRGALRVLGIEPEPGDSRSQLSPELLEALKQEQRQVMLDFQARLQLEAGRLASAAGISH